MKKYSQDLSHIKTATLKMLEATMPPDVHAEVIAEWGSVEAAFVENANLLDDLLSVYMEQWPHAQASGASWEEYEDWVLAMLADQIIEISKKVSVSKKQPYFV